MQYINPIAFDTKNNRYKIKRDGKWQECKFKDLIEPAMGMFPFITGRWTLKRMMKDLEK